MKKLLLVRHAKADLLEIGLSDFDRPLNQRGLKNAVEMAERLFQKSLVPEYLTSSPALRAFNTAEIFAKRFNLRPAVEIDAIYDATKLDLLNVINQFDNEFDYVGLFGHNPGISELLNFLTERDESMPTCGVAVISFVAEDWALLSAGTGDVVYYDYPKNG